MIKFNYSMSRFIFLTIPILLVISYSSTIYAQPGCPFPDPIGAGFLPKGQTIYYNFVGISGTQKTQVETAFSIWQTSNLSLVNCSNVSFTEGNAPSGKVQITVRNDSTIPRAARYNHEYNLATGNITSATIRFNLNFQVTDQGVTSNYYDSSKPGYTRRSICNERWMRRE